MPSEPIAPAALPVLRPTLSRDPLASAGHCPAAHDGCSESHVLSGARGIGASRVTPDIGQADVVQLLPSDGSSLLASSLDLPRYLGAATLSGDGATAAIEVGLALRPQGRAGRDSLIMDATDNTTDQPGLSRALHERMLPNGLKAAIPEMRSRILALDQSAAISPWELMHDKADGEKSPLSTRIGMVRRWPACANSRPPPVRPAATCW